MEEKKEEKEVKKGKKKSPVVGIVIVVIVVLLMIASLICGFLLSEMKIVNNAVEEGEKEDKDNTTDEEETSEQIVYDVKDEKINNLIRNIHNGFRDYGCNSIENLVNDKTITTNDLGSLNAYLIAEHDFLGDDKKRDSVPLEEFNNSVKKYLGKDYKFNPENIDYKGKGCPQYNYDKSTKTFNFQQTACGWTCGPSTYYEITKAVEENGTIEITVKVAFFKDNAYYSDYEKTNKILDGVEGIIPVEKGSTYKFTFKNEDGNYIFVSSEPIK